MKASELKASILQLAVSGKLVLQDPNDEPAGALLKRIKKEREALLKAGKIKKGKPLAEISEDEVPFEIPASWEWVRLGSIIELNPRNKLDDDLDVSFIPMTLIDDGYSNHHSSESRKWKEVKSGFTHFREGDLCLAKITPCFQNKKSAIFANLINGYGAGTTELHILRSFSSGIYLQYVLWYVKCPFFIYKGMETFTGTAGQERVSADVVANQPFPLPPLAEQHRIVARIEELMPLVEAYDREEQKLTALEAEFPDALRQSILQYAVEGKLVSQNAEDGTAAELLANIRKERDALVKEGKIKKGKPLSPVSEEEKPFEIPASWEWVRLGDIIQLISGRDLTPEEYTDKMCGIPYLIGASNVEDGIITVERWTEQPKVISLEHDLLLSCKGTIGKTAIQILPQAHIARQFMSLRPYFGIDIFYFKIFIDNYVPIFISEAKSMIPGISREDVLPILCPLPPLAEQRRIVERVQELMRLCGQLPTP